MPSNEDYVFFYNYRHGCTSYGHFMVIICAYIDFCIEYCLVLSYDEYKF